MSTKDEWGPWIEHDGSGCPVPVGTVVHQVRVIFGGVLNEFELIGAVEPLGRYNWDARYFGKPHPLEPWTECTLTTRYRIRNPRGLAILQDIAANPQRELETT